MLILKFFSVVYLGLVSLSGLSLENTQGTENQVLRYKVHTKQDLKCSRLDLKPHGVISTPLNFRTGLCKKERHLTHSESCLRTYENCYHDVPLKIIRPRLQDYAITLYFEYECLNKICMRVFQWRDVIADIDCTKSDKKSLRISSISSTYIYHLAHAKWHIHISLQVSFIFKLILLSLCEDQEEVLYSSNL